MPKFPAIIISSFALKAEDHTALRISGPNFPCRSATASPPCWAARHRAQYAFSSLFIRFLFRDPYGQAVRAIISRH